MNIYDEEYVLADDLADLVGKRKSSFKRSYDDYLTKTPNGEMLHIDTARGILLDFGRDPEKHLK